MDGKMGETFSIHGKVELFSEKIKWVDNLGDLDIYE